jgi:hypothetical protein
MQKSLRLTSNIIIYIDTNNRKYGIYKIKELKSYKLCVFIGIFQIYIYKL